MEHTETTSTSTPIVPGTGRTPGVLGVHPNTAGSESGKLIAFPDTDESINRAIARFQDNLPEWKYRAIGLADVVRNVADWARDLWVRFLPEEWAGTVITQPPILFRFQWESPRVLGHYQPGRNDLKFRWEISINPRHLIRCTEIEVAETVPHELLHCFEDLAGTTRCSHNNYHSAWLRKTAEEFGIPCTRYGGALGIRDPSPFVEWARERGMKGRPLASIETADLPPTRAPKRAAWVCSCPADVAVAVAVQLASCSELHARCERCGALFERRPARRLR